MLCSIVRTWECWGNLSGMIRPVICYRAAPGILLSSCPYTTGSAFTVAVWRPVLIGLPCSVSATHLTRVDRAKSSAGGHIPLCLKPCHKQSGARFTAARQNIIRGCQDRERSVITCSFPWRGCPIFGQHNCLAERPCNCRQCHTHGEAGK